MTQPIRRKFRAVCAVLLFMLESTPSRGNVNKTRAVVGELGSRHGPLTTIVDLVHGLHVQHCACDAGRHGRNEGGPA